MLRFRRFGLCLAVLALVSTPATLAWVSIDSTSLDRLTEPLEIGPVAEPGGVAVGIGPVAEPGSVAVGIGPVAEPGGCPWTPVEDSPAD